MDGREAFMATVQEMVEARQATEKVGEKVARKRRRVDEETEVI